MSLRNVASIYAVLLLLREPSVLADAPPRYKLTVLPLTFYSLSRGGGYGLNNRGQVVGDSSKERLPRGDGQPPLLRLALWQKGKTRLLISAETHRWMDRSSTAAGVNDRGQAIGNFQIVSSGGWSYYGSHAFLWSRGQLTLTPSLPGDDYGEVLGLNNLGEAVGSSNKNVPGQQLVDAPPGVDANAPHAFVYRQGKTIWLGLGTARAINDRGQIAGETGDSAVLWQNGVQKTLGEGEVSAINNAGLVVGTCGVAPRRSGSNRACFWRNGRQVLLSRRPSDAYGVNDRGQVVGTVQVPRPKGGRAALWQRGREYDLNRCVRLPKGWRLEKATRINDRGWVIGEGGVYGTSADKPRVNDFTFLLTPL